MKVKLLILIILSLILFEKDKIKAQNLKSEPRNTEGEYDFKPIDDKINDWVQKGYYDGANIICQLRVQK